MNILVWYAIFGFITVIWMIIETWWDGDDLKMKELWLLTVVFSVWPYIVFVAICEKIEKSFNRMIDKVDFDKVVIKGRVKEK